MHNRGVDEKLRAAYQDVFFGKPSRAQQQAVFCDIMSVTCMFTAASSAGLAPEVAEAKRELGLYIMANLGMAPSNKDDIFNSMSTLVRLMSQNYENARQGGDS